jgi:ubiquinone/menaquinone biosynthesis C-methylase UbiE
VANQKNRVCPVSLAGGLDNKMRRYLQNPRKILGPYIEEEMTVLDIGCGPGYFSIELAQLVGKSGKVIAADLQEGMLNKIRDKIQGTELESRIRFHKCETNKIGLSEKVDFVLAFYMVHEVPDKQGFFYEIKSMLKPNGHVLIIEPLFHTSKKVFDEIVRRALDSGLKLISRPKIFPNKVVFLQNG